VLDMGGEHGDQPPGDEHHGFGAVLRRTHLDPAATRPLDLARHGQLPAEEVDVAELERGGFTKS
jgi:hypothetical protein